MTALEAPRKGPEQTASERPRRWGLTSVPIPARRMASVPFVLVLGVFLALGMVGLIQVGTPGAPDATLADGAPGKGKTRLLELIAEAQEQ